MLLSAPEMMMLDEPLSALDSFLKTSVETELMPILYDFQSESKTVLFVSHDRDEIYRICQRIIVLDKGSITAQGTTDELFQQPQTVSAARLTGVKNIVPIQKTGSYQVRIPMGDLELTTSREVLETHTHIGIRAHHIREALPVDTVNCFECLVERQQSEPFRINEHLFILPDGMTNKTAPLIRYISGSVGPQLVGELCREVKRFHISPQDVVLLKD
jgi:molybdate transport system ATP-binding protein